MIEFIVAVDPRPNTKARHFVSVAQAPDRGLLRPCCHARKRDRFSAHRKPQKSLIDLAYFDMWPRRSPTFFREEPILFRWRPPRNHRRRTCLARRAAAPFGILVPCARAFPSAMLPACGRARSGRLPPLGSSPRRLRLAPLL